MEKIGADQLALYQAESGMIRKGVFHFAGAGLELSQQVAVSSLEVFQDIRQLGRRVLGYSGPERGQRYDWPGSCRWDSGRGVPWPA